MSKYEYEGVTRRDLMKFGAASAAASVAGSLPLAVLKANAAEPAAHRRRTLTASRDNE